MYKVGGKEQATAIRSFRRHLEKLLHAKVSGDYVAKLWIKSGLSRRWRVSFDRTNS